MTKPLWTAAARDDIYTQLCEAVTQSSAAAGPPAADTATELYLARLCLLLLEAEADPDIARRALADAQRAE